MEASSVRLQRLLEQQNVSAKSAAIENMPYATAASIASEYTKKIQYLEQELRDAHVMISEGMEARNRLVVIDVELKKCKERALDMEQNVSILQREKDEAKKMHRDAEEAYLKLFEKATDVTGEKETAVRNAKRDIERNLRTEYSLKFDEYEKKCEREMKSFRETQIKEVHNAILDAHFSVPDKEKMQEEHDAEVARLRARVDETVEYHVREAVESVKLDYEKKFLEQAIEVREKAD